MPNPFVAATALMTLAWLLPGSLAGQSDARRMLDSLAGALVIEARETRTERFVLHNDKPYYRAGTDILFKAYLIDSATGRVSSNPDNVYVELLDGADSVVALRILNGGRRSWDGSLAVPSRFPEGWYRLSAYTLGMATGLRGSAASVPVYIVNHAVTAPSSTPTSGKSGSPSTAVMNLQLVPEGGSLVSGVVNILAIRSTDPGGNPVSVEGRIVDDNRKHIGSFRTDVDGKCGFPFTPVRRRSYKAIVANPASRDSSEYRLPEIDDRALQVQVVRQDRNRLRLRVVLGDSLYAAKSPSYLIGMSGDRVFFAGIGRGMYEVDVPLEQARSGMAVFHVFDSTGTARSRRYIHSGKQGGKAAVETVQESIAPRRPVDVTVRLTDAEGRPVSGLLSIAVTDDRVVAWPDPPIQRVPDALDLIMTRPGTSGASRTGDTGIVISGTLFGSRDQALPLHRVNIFSETLGAVLTDTSDENGRYAFPPFDFEDGESFSVQVTDLSGQPKPARVSTDLPLPRLPGSPHPTPPQPLPPSAFNRFRITEADSILSGTSRVWVDGLASADEKQRKGVKSENRRTDASYRVTGEQLDRLGMGNTANGVRNLPGVVMMGNRLSIRGGMQSLTGAMDIEPIVIVDGVPAASSNVVDFLNSLNPQNIDYIEVMTGGEAAIYGSRGANGVIVVKTTNQLRPVNGGATGSAYIQPLGYAAPGWAWSPDHAKPAVREAAFNDNRATLHWEGELKAGLDGIARFRFFTSDALASCTVRVFGVTSEGDWIEHTHVIGRK